MKSSNFKVKIFYKKGVLFALLWMLILPLMACISWITPQTPTHTTSDINETPIITLSPSPSPTSQPLHLYLHDSLPYGFLDSNIIDTIITEDDGEAVLWLGERSQAPDGEILTSSTWVYTLAAPFPTLIDDIELSALETFWQGERSGNLSHVSRLVIPETLKEVLVSRWGVQDDIAVEFYKDTPETEQLWEENAWAILPFDALNPRLKVISIDGLSPLFKEFSVAKYPLTFFYDLIQREEVNLTGSETELQELLSTLPSTNRDNDKMTTLVMTGVTALVRATASRMEMNGITYPGEEIVHWLSEADLTHISNEVSFYKDCPFPDPGSRLLFFCSNPDYIELFDYVGADIIELTGNHNNDSWYVYGVDVVPFSLELYEEHGMDYFGGGLDLDDAMTPLLISHNGNQLAFIGCNASGPDYAWATDERGGAAPCGDYQWMMDEIARLKGEGYLPIATFQYYEDYYNFAAEHHIRDFSLMAEAGAVIVNGSQAHRPKAMTFEHGTFIDYGLGNLFFDQMGIVDNYGDLIIQTRWEVIQRHTFYDGRHLNTELLTAMLEDYAQPRPMTERERLVFLEELFTASGWESR
ncbi:MAG: CapA family protein [Chloroflexota bacterium]|jgi:poly-gamma-glutamate synthesis protein (capsule biosynthesis protein)|nr:CapA family protein [Chloroflexota bacterium]